MESKEQENIHNGKAGTLLTDLVAPGDEAYTWVLTIPFLIPPPDNSVFYFPFLDISQTNISGFLFLVIKRAFTRTVCSQTFSPGNPHNNSMR